MKYLIKVKYVGDKFAGFQYQNNLRTVQGELTSIFTELFSGECKVTGCSRTDSGVHANCFCATVETPEGSSYIPAEKLPLAVSSLMPSDISVFFAEEVPDGFHPRYSVKSKEYLYRIYVSETSDPFLYNRAWQIKTSLDDSKIEKMQKAAEYIKGRHDFSAFMASGSKITDAVRTVYSLDIYRVENQINVRISADGFLYNMVRIIVGTLVDIANGRISPDDLPAIIGSRDRSRAGMTAPAYGLYLNCVVY